MPSSLSRQSPSLPNRFVALVPCGLDSTIASAFETASKDAISSAWQSLSDQVYKKLNQTFSQLDPDWGNRWHSQVNNYFDISMSICPVNALNDSTMASLIGNQPNFGDVWDHAQKIREMHDVIPHHEKPRSNKTKLVSGKHIWKSLHECLKRTGLFGSFHRIHRNGPLVQNVVYLELMNRWDLQI